MTLNSKTNKWDKLPIDLLEVYFPKWELPWGLIWAWRFGTPVPLFYYVLWAIITKVWNPCPSFLLHNVGTDHEGVEPLCPFLLHTVGNAHQGVEPLSYFSTSHCGHWSTRWGTPVLLIYFTLRALITQVWKPCPTFLLHTAALITQVWNPPGSHFYREVNFSGKSTFPGSQLREVNFPGKTIFPGSQFFWEVNFPESQLSPGI